MLELGLAVLGLVAVVGAVRFYFGTAPVISTSEWRERLRRLDPPKR